MNTNIDRKTYRVSEIMQILGVSKATAYAFVKNDPPFKVIKICDTYRVIKESFDSWFNDSCGE